MTAQHYGNVIVIFLVMKRLKDMQNEFFLLITFVFNVMQYLIKTTKGRYNTTAQIFVEQAGII